ncbi:MAG: pitrilysin family protein [Bacteroidetes bacterium]|nr:pitrilysin family protein [Bacteroidota bacterium]
MADLNRLHPPAFHAVENIHLAEAKKVSLANGIPVYLLDAGTQEITRIEFIFRAGIRHQSQSLVCSGVNDMLDEGTHTRNAEVIAEELDFYGAFIETETEYDNASFTLFSLNKHLPSTLPVTNDIIRNASFPEEEFGIYLTNKKQKFVVDCDKVSTLARRRFNELLFGKHHAYGTFTKLEDFDVLTRESLIEFHKNNYTADRCTIIVSGKIPENLISLLDQFFGDAKWKKVSEPSDEKLPTPISDPQRVHTIEKVGAIQSAIRVGRVLFNKHHEDYLGMQVLNTVLGGYFGSRLMANIREDKGYTYGIGSGLVSMYDGGYFFISTEVGVDVTNATLKEIYFEIDKLQHELVGDDELELVRNYLIGVFLRSTDGPFAIGDRLKGILGYGLGYEYYDRYVNTIRTITPEKLRDLARRYLQKEDLIELVAGGRK